MSEPPAKAIANNSERKPAAPWRVGFRLDDNPKDVYIPRPAKPGFGTTIVSFIAKRAKDVATWERIEFELADGKKDVIEPVDISINYEFRQHEGAGVDLVLFTQDGVAKRSIGPLKRIHIYTTAVAVAAPRIAGKAVMVLNIGEIQETITPADLEAVAQHVLPGGNGQKAWVVSNVLASKIDVKRIKSIDIQSTGETRSINGKELMSATTTFYLRHNSRGELRLKVYRGGEEDKKAGLRDIARINIKLQQGK